MTAITKTSLPKNSLLYQNKNSFHYVDSYSAPLETTHAIHPADAAKAFFSTGPKWIDKLFAFRNTVASFFGLKTPKKNKREEMLRNFTCQPGEKVGLFQIFSRTDSEVILGEDDKHLNFRVSLFLHSVDNDSSKKNLTISTTVTFHNFLGRFYFLPVRPFHKLIVPAMLKSMAAELKKIQKK